LKKRKGGEMKNCSSLKKMGRTFNYPSVFFNENISWSNAESIHFHLKAFLSENVLRKTEQG
jgi:hypothetical protein